ncbi:MAG: S-layer protein domain-containing protein [Methanosarcina thermophila]
MKKASLQIFTAILVLGLFCGAVTAAPSLVADPTPSTNSTVTGIAGTSQIFAIPLNESATVTWNIRGETTTTQTDSNNVATLDHTLQQGSYQVIASIDGLDPIIWNVEGTAGALAIINPNPQTNPSTRIGESQEFSIETNKEANITWYIDGQQVKPAIRAMSDMYQNTTASSAGIYNVTVIAEDGNETASYRWDWTVSAEGVPVNFAPSEETVKVEQGKSQTFSVSSTNNQSINVEWFVNDINQKTDTGVTSSSYELRGDNATVYTLKAVISDPSGVYDQSTRTWNVTIEAPASGNRIWEEGMPTTYTWNAQSYSGFYYDLDSGVSSEEMRIENIERSIDAGNIKYITRPTETDFEYNRWGSYQVIGFMAEKYFAGYSENSVIGDDVSLISDGILSKILIDSDDKKSAYAGDSLILEDGYSLNIVEVDVNGKTVWIQLEKDGNVVDDAFISSGQDYVYETDLGEAEDVPIIIAHFGTVFSGTETSAAFIEGVFQISDNYIEINNGDTFGEMEVKSTSSNEIRMENEDSIGLDKGETIDLMGKIKLRVADDSKLRFAPILDTSESGTYELRGTVYDEDKDGNSTPVWNPFNFEGFYYNIDEGIGTEELRVEELNGRTIPSDKLVYESKPQKVQFEYRNWGNFMVVGFMADKYFAGYEDGAVNGAVDDVSLLSDNILAKILIDSDDRKSMYSGSALVLENGYSLNIVEVDINGDTVWVQLEKDGEVVDEAFVASNQDYIYETDIGEAEDIPLIIVHFGTVFAGTETSAVFTQGIFQISDEYIEIENGESFGEMEVSSVSESGIRMKNDDDIGLDRGETIEIMGNISFKVADDNVLRFYPAVEIQNEDGASRELKISVPDEIVVGDTFDIGVTAGDSPVEGASVNVNTTNIGKTDANGTVKYTAENIGPLKLTAQKDGYTTANKNVNVIPPKEKMTVSVSPETAYVGDTLEIEVVKAIGGDPIEGANVSINGNLVNKTGPDGKVSYKTDKSGTLKLSVTKEGFLDLEEDIRVRDFEAIFEFSNLVVEPLEVSAGKAAKISIDVGNIGNAAGNQSVELFINGNATESKEISLDVGKNTTVTFEHVEEVPGTYRVEVGGETATYTVKEKSSLLLYALGAFFLLIVGGAAYFFTKGGGDISMIQEKIKELKK